MLRASPSSPCSFCLNWAFPAFCWQGRIWPIKTKSTTPRAFETQKAKKKDEEKAAQSTLTTQDVYGNTIVTNSSFTRMKQMLEYFIELYGKETDTKVCNTTKGGAAIAGAPFVPLEDLLKTSLPPQQVEEDWHAMGEDNYDRQAVGEKLKDMKKSQNSFHILLKEIQSILSKMTKLARDRNFKQVEIMYRNLDEKFNMLQNNDYFNVCINPMNRVYYQLMSEELKDVNYERNKSKKAESVINVFGRFLHVCQEDVDQARGLMEIMEEGMREEESLQTHCFRVKIG